MADAAAAVAVAAVVAFVVAPVVAVVAGFAVAGAVVVSSPLGGIGHVSWLVALYPVPAGLALVLRSAELAFAPAGSVPFRVPFFADPASYWPAVLPSIPAVVPDVYELPTASLCCLVRMTRFGLR